MTPLSVCTQLGCNYMFCSSQLTSAIYYIYCPILGSTKSDYYSMLSLLSTGRHVSQSGMNGCKAILSVSFTHLA